MTARSKAPSFEDVPEDLEPSPDCDLCSRAESRAKVVFADTADGETDYLVVLESPSAGDERYGYVGSGAHGDILRSITEEVGIDIDRVSIAPLVRCHAGDVNKGHWQACVPFLFADIKRIKPRIIITLGNPALTALTGLTGITAQRGNIYPDLPYGCPVVPTISLGMLFRSPASRVQLVADFRKAKAFLENKIVEPQTTEAHVARTVEEAEHFRNLLLRDAERLAIDIETTGLNPFAANARTLCFGASHMVGHGWVFPFYGQWARDIWTPKELSHVRGFVRDICASDIPKDGSNLKFDISYLEATTGIQVEEFAFDCQYAFGVIDENSNHNLELMRSLFTQMPRYDDFKDRYKTPKDKEDIRSSGYALFPEEELWKYQAADADCEFRVSLALRKLLLDVSEGCGGLFSRIA